MSVAADFVGDGAHVWIRGVEKPLRLRDTAGEHDVDVARSVHLKQVEVHDVACEVGRNGCGIQLMCRVESAKARPDGAPVVGPVHALGRGPYFAAAAAEEVQGAVLRNGELGQVVAVCIRIRGQAETDRVLGGHLLAVHRHHRELAAGSGAVEGVVVGVVEQLAAGARVVHLRIEGHAVARRARFVLCTGFSAGFRAGLGARRPNNTQRSYKRCC